MYTPEKSRKSLPLLLEGNLPCRRTRRQSGGEGEGDSQVEDGGWGGSQEERETVRWRMLLVTL